MNEVVTRRRNERLDMRQLVYGDQTRSKGHRDEHLPGHARRGGATEEVKVSPAIHAAPCPSFDAIIGWPLRIRPSLSPTRPGCWLSAVGPTHRLIFALGR